MIRQATNEVLLRVALLLSRGGLLGKPSDVEEGNLRWPQVSFGERFKDNACVFFRSTTPAKAQCGSHLMIRSVRFVVHYLCYVW